MESSFKNFLKRKREGKITLTNELKFSAKKPLLAIILEDRLKEEDEVKLRYILEGIEAINTEVVVMCDEDCEFFEKMNHVQIMRFNRINRRNLMEAADLALCFEFNDVEEMLLHGIIPVSAERPDLMDYDANHETGYGFIYKNTGVWGVFAALVRAVETFKFPYDWKHIMQEGIRAVKEA
ncbi:hypothetical protein JKY72_04490 [Candidatus Gracilibacteria bacterium]|nr:hypothetical protein [Candidatus Gracilibacteria bacterium]